MIQKLSLALFCLIVGLAAPTEASDIKTLRYDPDKKSIDMKLEYYGCAQHEFVVNALGCTPKAPLICKLQLVENYDRETSCRMYYYTTVFIELEKLGLDMDKSKNITFAIYADDDLEKPKAFIKAP